MRSSLVRLLIVAIMIAACAAFWLQADRLNRKQRYRIGWDINPPYQFSGPDGAPRGLAIEVIQTAARVRGIQFDWVYLPKGPDEALRSGEADAWPMIVGSPERTKEFSLSRPWITTNLWLVNLQGAAPYFDGSKLGVHRTRFPRQFAAERLPQAVVLPYSSRTEVLESVCNKKIQSALIESRNFMTLLLDRPEACQSVALEGLPFPGSTLELSVISTKQLSALSTELRNGITDAAGQGLIASHFDQSRLGTRGEGVIFESLLRSEQEKANMWKLLAGLLLSLSAVVLLAIGLRRAQRRAELADATKSRFLAQMSHEIRTPMNGVLGMAELLLSCPLPPRERELAKTISSSGTALMTILNDILDVSKLEAGKLEMESIDYSLHEVLNTVRQTLEPLACFKSLEFTVVCDPLLPPWLKGDPVRLAQILLNLGSNAIKFTANGSVHIDASIGRNQSLLLKVTDTGIGISASDQARLFEPFTQATTSIARTHGGTGLGLAICQMLVELMNGTIQLTSQLGKGSTFVLELPLQPGAAPDPKSSVLPEIVASRPMNILVAEDNFVNQRVVRGLLEKLGHTVEVVSHGEEALASLEARRYDVIFMDRHMPVMDGIESTRAIRGRERSDQRVWIIALTASSLDQDRLECLECGMDDHVSKPISSSKLQAVLARVPAPSGPSHQTEN